MLVRRRCVPFVFALLLFAAPLRAEDDVLASTASVGVASSPAPAGVAAEAPEEPASASAAPIPEADAAVPEGTAAEDAPYAAEDDLYADEYDPLFDDEYDSELEPTPDPLEPMNRKFFQMNVWLDAHFWEPVTTGYRFVVPEPGRVAIRRVFQNAGAAPVFVNDVLQLRFRQAGETLGRFVLNTTLGLGGLFDPAAEAGWHYHDADFGQTLALYGVPTGPYLVLPVFGPSTVRDGFGDVVDRAFEPLNYILGIGLLSSGIQVAIGTGSGITTYEAHIDELDALEEGSIDFYSALRSVYLQSREASVREVREDSLLSFGRDDDEGDAPAPPAVESSTASVP